jgi:hypothetical protein
MQIFQMKTPYTQHRGQRPGFMATLSQEYPVLSVGSSVRGKFNPVKNPHPFKDSLNAPTRSPLTAELVNDISNLWTTRPAVVRIFLSNRPVQARLTRGSFNFTDPDSITSFNDINDCKSNLKSSCSVDSSEWILHTPFHIESTGNFIAT